MQRTNQSLNYGRALDASGNIATFESNADILSDEDNDQYDNVFIRNRQTGTTTLVSRATGAGGAAGNGDSYDTAISADGTKVVFSSSADNLVPGDTNNEDDVFLRDLTTNTTTLVSRADGADGEFGDLYSDVGSVGITNVGHVVVAFESRASNLVAGDTNSQSDVFVRDVTDGTTKLISRADGASGTLSDGFSGAAFISADGATVGFTSLAKNIDPDDTSAVEDAYVRHLATNDTELVSRATGAAGAKGNSNSSSPVLDATGTHVLFASQATNLNANATNGTEHVYRRTLGGSPVTDIVDLANGSTTTVGDARSCNGGYSMTTDGSKVAFCTLAGNLTSDNDTNSRFDVYLRDMGTNATTLLSRATGAAGALGDSDSNQPWINGDGTVTVFGSRSTNFSAENDDSVTNVYDRAGTTTELLSKPAAVDTGTRPAYVGGVSRGGRYVVFSSQSDGLVATDDDSVINVYVRDNETGITTLVSQTQAGVAGNADSDAPVISADGSKVAFETKASNLGGDAFVQIAVKDLATGALTVASRPDNSANTLGNQPASNPVLSADGNRVLFVSSADNLVPGWTSAPPHAYVRDLTTNDTFGADAVDGTASTPSDSYIIDAQLDSSGSKVVFTSGATNLVPGVTGTKAYLRDLSSNSTTVVSRDSAGTPVDGSAVLYSSDGPTVAFTTQSAMDPADSGTSADIYARNLSTGAVSLVTRAGGSDGARINAGFFASAMSAEGHIVTFWTTATNLGVGDTSRAGHLFYRDLMALETDAADRADGANGALGNAAVTFKHAVSADACCIGFSSYSTNLVPGWDGGGDFPQAYVRNILPPSPTQSNGGGNTPPPPGDTATPPSVQPPADKQPPAMRLGGAKKQKLLKTKAILVTVLVDEAATVRAGATLNVPGHARVYRLKSLTKKAAANKRVTFKLKLSKSQLKAVKRALRAKKKVVATVKVTARDAAGNARSATRKVRAIR